LADVKIRGSATFFRSGWSLCASILFTGSKALRDSDFHQILKVKDEAVTVTAGRDGDSRSDHVTLQVDM
jgi:hypothetical protein